MQCAHRPSDQLKLYRKTALRAIAATNVPLTQKCGAARVPERIHAYIRRCASVFYFGKLFTLLCRMTDDLHMGDRGKTRKGEGGDNATRQRANGRAGYFISLSESDARCKRIFTFPRYSCLSSCGGTEPSCNAGERGVAQRISDWDVQIKGHNFSVARQNGVLLMQIERAKNTTV